MTHYRNLIIIHDLGVQITKMHRVISVFQSDWLKQYIDFNTTSEIKPRMNSKHIFKLTNNSVFGKTMENVKNRMELILTSENEKAIKLFSKFDLKDSRFCDGLNMIEMYKRKSYMTNLFTLGHQFWT